MKLNFTHENFDSFILHDIMIYLYFHLIFIPFFLYQTHLNVPKTL